MYNASVPAFVKMLGNLSNILDKAAAHCEAKKIQPAVLLATRLTPDMFPLSQQIQLTTTHVHWTCALLAGQERPNLPNTETTIDEMKQRVANAIAFAKGFKPEQIDGSETRPVKLVFPAVTLEFTGESYLTTFAIPNFYFHYTTAYAILRQVGVGIGKRDFTG
jgi:hypothetical protein